MKITHDYAARIDYDLWVDCMKVKELDGGTTSINALLNEGLKMVRDRKMQEITAQRKRRNTPQSMVNRNSSFLDRLKNFWLTKKGVF